jgi:DNA-binding transcriptional LysR family regulator
MDFRHLKYFLAVADQLSFSRAAQRLNIAQPPLSQQIQRLERELGVILFTRTRRRVELTSAGRAILDCARRAVAQADQVAQLARQVAHGEAGVLRLGFSSAALYTDLPAILRAFRWRHPQVVLNLFERSSEQQIAMLTEGALDAAVVRLPTENAPHALAVKSLLREPLVLAIPRRHRLADRARVPIRALNSEPLIIFPRHVAPGLYDQIAGLCRDAGFAPNVAQEAAEIATMVSLVSVGLGVAIVPNSVRNLQRAMVRYRELVPTAMTELALAYEADNSSAVLRSFVDTVEQRAQN